MWRLAVVRFGAVALVALACGSAARPATTIGNRAATGERDLTGAYYCNIQDRHFVYPAYPCVVRKVDGRWWFAKLGGSQRIRGEVTPAADGFSFAGELYCPWGDCSRPLHGEFRGIGGGVLRGNFRDATLVLVLSPAPDSAFGGASYGGDGYGGLGYGGATYGTPLQRRNRQP